MSAAASNEDRPLARSVPLAPLTWFLGIVAVAIGLSPTLPERLQFDAVAIVGGEYWRFLTGHLVHWNLDHLCWDLSVFVVLGTMCEHRGRRTFLACVLGSAAAISLWTLVALPQMPIYRGLSGIDTGLFALLGVGLLADARAGANRAMQWIIAAAMLGLIGKITYEFASDATIFVDHTAAAFVPVPIAHVLGSLVGFAAGLVSLRSCTSIKTPLYTSVPQRSRIACVPGRDEAVGARCYEALGGPVVVLPSDDSRVKHRTMAQGHRHFWRELPGDAWTRLRKELAL
jgi:rhomboid family GlyGly-CTERM serine protease